MTPIHTWQRANTRPSFFDQATSWLMDDANQAFVLLAVLVMGAVAVIM